MMSFSRMRVLAALATWLEEGDVWSGTSGVLLRAQYREGQSYVGTFENLRCIEPGVCSTSHNSSVADLELIHGHVAVDGLKTAKGGMRSVHMMLKHGLKQPECHKGA